MKISSLAQAYIPSPYYSNRNGTIIDTITVHCMAQQYTAEKCGEIFQRPNKNASATYGIGSVGDIACYVPEEYRPWSSSNRDNDMRAITIEVACEPDPPHIITAAARLALVQLLADIVRRYDSIPLLRWTGNKADIGNIAVQNMTVHRWFSHKACPGEYLMHELPLIAKEVNALVADDTTVQTIYSVQVGAFENYNNALAFKDKLINNGYQAWIYAKQEVIK